MTELWILFFLFLFFEAIDVFSTYRLYLLCPGKGFQETNPLYDWGESNIKQLLTRAVVWRIAVGLIFFICLVFFSKDTSFIAVCLRMFYVICGYCLGVVFCNLLEIRLALKKNSGE